MSPKLPQCLIEMNRFVLTGAHNWNRTSDLSLTKGVLYRLSYAGETSTMLPLHRLCGPAGQRPNWSG